MSGVLESCLWVAGQAKHATVNAEAVARVAASITDQELQRLSSPGSFDADLHFVDRGSPEGEALTVQYLLVVDALNFCFWPEAGLEYHHLAGGVKAALQADRTALSAERLSRMTGEGVQALLGRPQPVPLQEERARLLREVGQALQREHNGSAAKLVKAANGSALTLLRMMTALFPGFRDHAVYKGRQVFFYKRAQIFIGDVYGALQGQGLGAFHDMDQLTMFADYRVPVVLRVLGLLDYTPELETKIQALTEIAPGSEEECEIRAATVVATEMLRAELAKRQPGLLAVTLDWWLWEMGERSIASHPPHHRTLTVYY